MLYLIATPIGNLSDFSFRAIETIKQCDYLLCEDTRRSGILLKHYDISKPLKSFHLHNERKRESSILQDLESEKTIALLSDAGTPGISDPGSRLVKSCRDNNIPVIAIPGPCAAIVALSASGLPTDRFQFFGFLPRKKGKATTILKEILAYPGTTICYESPFRLAKTLALLAELSPDCKIVVARELTKKFETYYSGPVSELVKIWKDKNPKGEIVLLISPIEAE